MHLPLVKGKETNRLTVSRQRELEIQRLSLLNSATNLKFFGFWPSNKLVGAVAYAESSASGGNLIPLDANLKLTWVDGVEREYARLGQRFVMDLKRAE